MHLKYRNVNEAFRDLVSMFTGGTRVGGSKITRSSSRVGNVLYIPEPVTITYTHPRERVLFNQARDCNPFFHVYETLWMLAGRNDIAGPAYYAANYRDCVQDGDSPYANGAYGFRWRGAFGVADNLVSTGPHDQLALIIDQLKRKPDSRRCVLQMWNVQDDLLKIDNSKDVCCNTQAYFSLRQSAYYYPEPDGKGGQVGGVRDYLDMTVCNRSNDLIWGALGANVVHFSFLQEYLAACIGVEVGMYHQFTNNLHVYEERFKPDEWLEKVPEDGYPPGDLEAQFFGTFPLVKDPATFDREVVEFVEKHCGIGASYKWNEPFLRDVAQWMMIAFHWHKLRLYERALKVIECVKADDWRLAGTSWLLKRKANYEARLNKV